MSSSSAFTRLHGIFSKTPKHLSAIATATATATAISTTKEATPTSQIPEKVQAIVKRFKKNSKYANFRSRKDYYEAAVRRLAAEKHYSAIDSILEHQKKYKDNMASEGFVVRLIILYGKAGMFDHAYKVFDELPKFNCPRTVKSFNALLLACVKSEKFDKVSELFSELPGKLGVEPDVVSYNMVINGLCELKDFDSAMKVIEMMEASDISPNCVSYNTILEAYYKENNLAEAEKLWQRMKEMGVVFDVWTYNSKIRSLIKNDRVQEALELVEKMVKEEVNPITHTYNALIKGCVDNGNLVEAKMFHGKMMADGCLPDYATYQMLISFACDKGDIDFAFELCKQSVELKVPIYRSLMQLVVDTLVKRSKIVEASELVALVNSIKRHRYTLIMPLTTLLE